MKKLLLFTTTLLITTILNAQTVSELFTGLTYPSGLAIDQNNVLYFGETSNEGKYIYTVNSDGSRNQFIETAQNSEYLMFDTEGNLFSTGGIEGQTIKISPDGSTVVSIKKDFSGKFVFDTQKNTYYTNSYTVYKRNPKGTVSMFADGFSNIGDFAVDIKDNIYIVDALSRSITKINKDGTVLGTISELTNVSTLVVDQNENIYFDETVEFSSEDSSEDIDMISKYNFETKIKEVYAKEGITGLVNRIAIDQNNIVYVSCPTTIKAASSGNPNGKIYKIVPATLSTIDYEKNVTTSYLTPNPTTGIFSVDAQVKWVDIYDLQGTLVYNNTSVDTKTISISDLAAGIYTAHLTDINNQKSVTKLVKK